LGIRDDLRVGLVSDDGSCWASLYAYRHRDVFRPEEVALLGAAAGDLAHAVRLALLRADAEAAANPEAPGLLLLRPDGTLSAVSGLAEQWLSLIAPNGRLPSAVTSLSAALRSSSPGPRTARVQLADGRGVALHALHLDDAGGALIVEMARPLEVAEVLCAAYGLSRRDVVGLVLRGETKARRPGLSASVSTRSRRPEVGLHQGGSPEPWPARRPPAAGALPATAERRRSGERRRLVPRDGVT
jgi:hypothetical protein